MIAVSHTLLCRGKSLIVVLASSLNSSKSLFTCQTCQKLTLPLVPLIIFQVFAAPCLNHSLRGAVFLGASVLQEGFAWSPGEHSCSLSSVEGSSKI